MQELPEAINGRGKVIDNSVAFDTFLNIIRTLQAELMPEDEHSAYTFAIYQNYKQQIQMMDDTKLSNLKNLSENASSMKPKTILMVFIHAPDFEIGRAHV